MATTKTAAKPAEPFLPEQAAAAVKAAQARRSEVLDRIAAGGNVEPVELAEADDALRLAELRIEVGERNAAANLAATRAARLQELVDQLTGPGHRQHLEAVLDAYRAALDALQALHRAAHARQDGVIASLREVGHLAKLIDTLPGVDVDLDAWGCQSLTANGVTAAVAYYRDEPTALVADVAATVVKADPASSARAALSDAVNNTPGGRLQALERILAAGHDGDD